MRKFVAGILVAVTLLAGCASLGIPSADTFNKRLAAAYVVNTGVRTNATVLLRAGQISVADAENVLKQTDVARQGLDVTRVISKTDVATADQRLNAVRAGLAALQSYLNSRGK